MSRAGLFAATVAVGLGVGIALTDTSAAAAPLREGPCTAELTPPPSLLPPTGLRIIGGGEFLDDLMDLWSGPNAGPEPESVEAEPPPVASHPYFDQLVQRPDCLIAYSLRSQAQIERYRQVQQVPVNYDPVVDAAKWQWTSNDTTASNLRLPILLERPASGSRRILIISDHLWDTSWFTEFKDANGNQIGGWKWMQVTTASGPGSSQQRIWFEPQMRGIGDNPWVNDNPKVLSLFGAREYLDVRAPTINSGVVGCGIDFGESIGPMGCFKGYANRWTRAWIEIIVTAGDDYAAVSWWMADEQQNAVQILNRAQLKFYSPILQFWYEYDTSSETRSGGPMAAWGRNVVVLKDVADPTSVFARPTR